MSYWLKSRVNEIGSRDVLDMYNDVCWLKELLEGILKEQTDESDLTCALWEAQSSKGGQA